MQMLFAYVLDIQGWFVLYTIAMLAIEIIIKSAITMIGAMTYQ